jgi:hypothetical protein
MSTVLLNPMTTVAERIKALVPSVEGRWGLS